MERHVTHLPYTWNQRNKKDNKRFIDSKTTRAVVVRGKAGKGIKRHKPLVTEYRSNGEVRASIRNVFINVESSHCGTAEMHPISIREDAGSEFLSWLSG